MKNIKELIPQADPFVMVSSLISVSEKKAHTQFNVKQKNVLCENGYLLEAGLIENIAQSAAAMTGYNAVTNNENVKKGFIGSVNNLEIRRLVKVGETIDTNVFVENQVMNVHIIKGIVRVGHEIIAQGEMKIFLEE